MTSELPVRLRAGNLLLELSPSIGGSISAFERFEGEQPIPILRRCNRPLQNVLAAASFPLVPFVNRIRGGEFRFRGRDVRLAPNMADDPSPLRRRPQDHSPGVDDRPEGMALGPFARPRPHFRGPGNRPCRRSRRGRLRDRP